MLHKTGCSQPVCFMVVLYNTVDLAKYATALMTIHKEGEDTTIATYELQPDEVILYEGNVTCKTYKGSLQLTLTSQKVVFEKEKGFVKKERELVDVIPLESVRLYNDAAQIKQKGADVEVQTVGKNITIVFSGMLEARKFTAKIVNAVTGTTLATRGSNMIKDAFA